MKAWLTRAAPWLAAALGAAFTLAAFYPGYLSFDSADQWQQARHFAFTSVHPPLLAMLWHLVDRVWPGSGGMLALQVLLYWGGLALLLAQLPRHPLLRALAVLVLGLWPPLLGLLPHLWKDVPMTALLVLAVALALRDLRHPSGWARVAVLGCLVAACALRHNAVLAVLPLCAWLTWRHAERQRWQRPRWQLGGLALLLTAGVQALASLPARHPAVTRTDSVWSVVALWDIAAVSLREQRLLFPPDFASPELTLDQLRRDFREDINTTIYASGKLRHSFDTPYSPSQRAALARAWLGLPFDHPRAYFAHRLRLSELLLGFDQGALPDYLVFSPGIFALGDNPPLQANSSPLNRWLQGQLDALVDTPWFAGWWYLLATLPLLRLAWRRRLEAQLAAAVIASAWLYTLPLAVIAGSAEFRYLGWLVQATLLAAVLLIGNRTTEPEPEPA